MDIRPVLVAGLFGATVFSGCVGAPDSDGEIAFSEEGTGIIRGLVVDDEFFPLPNTRVMLLDDRGSANVSETLASNSGAFEFAPVPAGEYVVRGELDGYYSNQVSVDVLPAETAEVTILLAARPTLEPYLILLPWTGLIVCGFAFVMAPGNCGPNRTGVPESFTRYSRHFVIPDGFAAIVSETTWRASEEGLVALFNASKPIDEVLERVMGPIPLKIILTPGYQAPNISGRQVFSYGQVSDGGTFKMRQNVWWLGYFSSLFRPLDPVCREFPGAYPRCSGVGFTTELRFTVWVSIFVYGAPADLATYTALPDQ